MQKKLLLFFVILMAFAIPTAYADWSECPQSGKIELDEPPIWWPDIEGIENEDKDNAWCPYNYMDGKEGLCDEWVNCSKDHNVPGIACHNEKDDKYFCKIDTCLLCDEGVECHICEPPNSECYVEKSGKYIPIAGKCDSTNPAMAVYGVNLARAAKSLINSWALTNLKPEYVDQPCVVNNEAELLEALKWANGSKSKEDGTFVVKNPELDIEGNKEKSGTLTACDILALDACSSDAGKKTNITANYKDLTWAYEHMCYTGAWEYFNGEIIKGYYQEGGIQKSHELCLVPEGCGKTVMDPITAKTTYITYDYLDWKDSIVDAHGCPSYPGSTCSIVKEIVLKNSFPITQTLEAVIDYTPTWPFEFVISGPTDVIERGLSIDRDSSLVTISPASGFKGSSVFNVSGMAGRVTLKNIAFKGFNVPIVSGSANKRVFLSTFDSKKPIFSVDTPVSAFINKYPKDNIQLLTSAGELPKATFEKAEQLDFQQYRLTFKLDPYETVHVAEFYKNDKHLANACSYYADEKTLTVLNKKYGLVGGGKEAFCNSNMYFKGKTSSTSEEDKVSIDIYSDITSEFITPGAQFRVIFHGEGDPIAPIADTVFTITDVDDTIWQQNTAKNVEDAEKIKKEGQEKMATWTFNKDMDSWSKFCKQYMCCKNHYECIDKCGQVNACGEWEKVYGNNDFFGGLDATVYKENCSELSEKTIENYLTESMGGTEKPKSAVWFMVNCKGEPAIKRPSITGSIVESIKNYWKKLFGPPPISKPGIFPVPKEVPKGFKMPPPKEAQVPKDEAKTPQKQPYQPSPSGN